MSAYAAAIGSWVTITTVWPSSSTASRSSARMSLPVAVSSAPGRLVGEDHLRPGDQRAGDRDALLLAARELARPVLDAVAEPDAAGHLVSQSASARRLARRSGSVMFCSAVSDGTRLKDWKTKPMRSRRSR